MSGAVSRTGPERTSVARSGARHRVAVIVYPVVETFIRREDAERCIEEVPSDDPELAAKLRIEEREQVAGELNEAS